MSTKMGSLPPSLPQERENENYLHLDGGGDAFVAALHHIDDVCSIWFQHCNMRLAGDLAEKRFLKVKFL